MILGDYEKQVQKATREPTQAISYGKGRLSQKAEPRDMTEVPRATENNGSGPCRGLHPALRRGGPGHMCLAGF